MVVFDRGRLVGEPWVTLHDGILTLDTHEYVELPGFQPPVRVFRRVPPGVRPGGE